MRGLPALAANRIVLRQRRVHHACYHAPVVFVHARTVGVEDARDAHLDPVLARVADGQRLCAALALVVAVG